MTLPQFFNNLRDNSSNMSQVKIREDFRRDGLAATFFLGASAIEKFCQAFPHNRVNIGYPSVCEGEYNMCEAILDAFPCSKGEPCLTAHARIDHLEQCSNLAHRYECSANIWIPISESFIANTVDTSFEAVLKQARNCAQYWQNNTSTPIDIALADATNAEQDRVKYAVRRCQKNFRDVILCDTRGKAEAEEIRQLLEALPRKDHLEYHPHMDSGNVKDTIKAVLKSGVNKIGTSLYNLGERLTMIDTRQLKSFGLDCDEDFQDELEAYFEDEYFSKCNPETVFGDNIITTGTQYRLRDRDQNLKEQFGVTSDSYIAEKVFGKKPSSEKLSSIKTQYLYNQSMSETVDLFLTDEPDI